MAVALDFISKNGGIVGAVLLVAMALNIVLSGIKSLIMLFEKDPAKQAADSKLSFIDKVLSVVSKVVDFLSANVQHK